MKDKYSFLEVYEGMKEFIDYLMRFGGANANFFKRNTNNVPPVHFFGYFKNNYYVFQCISQHNDHNDKKILFHSNFYYFVALFRTFFHSREDCF